MTIEQVAVLGLGTMGHGIAQTFAIAGLEVRCFDDVPAARDTLRERVQSNLDQLSKAGLLNVAEIPAILSRLHVFDSEQDAVSKAQFITEAVSEELRVKQALFARLEDDVGDDVILASNTSSYPMTQISQQMRHPERALNTHWFNPPHIVPLVEVVPGERTVETTTLATIELLRRIGKLPIRLNQEVPGFLVNRIQTAMMREIWDLWQRGVASAEDIDLAVRSSIGLRLAVIGPMQVCDFAGLDIWSKVYGNLAPDLRADSALPERIGKLVASGHLGAKTGQGIFADNSEVVAAKMQARDKGYLELIKLMWR